MSPHRARGYEAYTGATSTRRVRILKYFFRLYGDLRGVWHIADRSTAVAYFLAVFSTVPSIIRTRTLVPADAKMGGRVCRFTPYSGNTVTLDGSSFSSARELYCRRVYSSQRGFDIEPGDIVVDLGANAGLFTTLAAVVGQFVISVEAQSGFLPIIRRQLVQNHCSDRVIIEHALVGGATGLLSDDAIKAASTHWGSAPAEMTVGEIISKYDLPRVDFLKVDIEGSEFDAFSGDLSWLTLVRRMVIEVHCAFGDVGLLCQRIQNSGFVATLVDDDTGTPVREIGGGSGYLFAYKEVP